MNIFKKLFQPVLLILFFWTNMVFADDIGINAARLTQLSDSTYLFEADFSQLVISDFDMPVFPDRFHVSDPEFINNMGLITIKIKISTSGEPLNEKDKILLPWRRNGVSFTVQWIDGTIHQGLFQRTVDGIHVPLNLLMSTEKTMKEVIGKSFSNAINHFKFAFIHLFLVLSLVFFLPKRKVFTYLVIFAFGQASSMLLFELNVPGFDLLYIDLLILILVISLAVSSIKKIEFNYLSLLLFIIGLLHGISVANEAKALDLPLQLELTSLFTFNVTIDLIHFGLALIFIPILTLLKRKPKYNVSLKFALGTIAVFLILGIFNNNVLSGNSKILLETDSQNSTLFSRFAQKSKSQVAARPQAAQTMTNPILSYLSIEPFEIRHEILMKASTALELLNISYEGKTDIPIDSLASIQAGIIVLFADGISLQIDDLNKEPIIAKADFVTLGMAGVSLRPEPMIESIDDGIIGVSFVYETKTLANGLSLNWDLFPESLEKVDVTTIDPFGVANFILTPDEPVLNWKSTLSGYIVPQVEEIAVESPRVSLVSLVIFVIALLMLLFSSRLKVKKQWIFVFIAIGFVLYPFVRSPLNVNFIKQWKPSNERSASIISGLLTNVYRSFDYRKESDVYDRLAISVLGDQLSQIYIEQRKGLEIENRGGAKAKVNDVEILEVYEVKTGLKDDYGIEISWKINGSVSHFGHMHYRQNRYRAIIWITPDKGNWKIEKIEMLDEERLM